MQAAVGKTKWIESAGETIQEARRKSPAFIARTDALISTWKQTGLLSTDELIEQLPGLTTDLDLADLNVGLQMLALQGVDLLTKEQAARGEELLLGGAEPKKLFTAQDLLDIKWMHSNKNLRTHVELKSKLESFLAFCKVSSPLHPSRDHAEDYLEHLITSGKSKGTIRTTLAQLSGLWSALRKQREYRQHDQIFQNLTSDQRLKPTPAEEAQKMLTRGDLITTSIGQWDESACMYVPIFRILYYTGARLAEICALRGEDIKADRISIEWMDERGLKNAHSQRPVPIHPDLEETLKPLRQIKGSIWPSTMQINKTNKFIRWGANLAKPCKKVTGLHPHGLRHRVTNILVENDIPERTIAQLLGHSKKTMTQKYGGLNWQKLVDAIALID